MREKYHVSLVWVTSEIKRKENFISEIRTKNLSTYANGRELCTRSVKSGSFSTVQSFNDLAVLINIILIYMNS